MKELKINVIYGSENINEILEKTLLRELRKYIIQINSNLKGNNISR